MTRSKTIQEDYKEKKDSPPKVTDDFLTKEDQELKENEVPTDGNPVPKKEGDEKEILTSPEVSIPFPYKVINDQRGVQFRKFLEVMIKRHINLPFIEAISQMPSYVKHLKEILLNKGKLKNFGSVGLNEDFLFYGP